MPIEKSATAHEGTAETPFDLPNICFMGSAVVSGIGSGIVVLTGPRTAFGIVATAMAETRQLTSFDKGITHFTWLMLGFILVMAPLVFVINGVTKGNWLEALLFAVAVAVGLTPEMLPMIVTVNLAKSQSPARRSLLSVSTRSRTSEPWTCCARTRPAHLPRTSLSSSATLISGAASRPACSNTLI